MFRPLRPSPQRGFTLLELIIVVAVLGILAAIAFVGYQSVLGNTDETVRNYEVAQVDRQTRATGAALGQRPRSTVVSDALLANGDVPPPHTIVPTVDDAIFVVDLGPDKGCFLPSAAQGQRGNWSAAQCLTPFADEAAAEAVLADGTTPPGDGDPDGTPSTATGVVGTQVRQLGDWAIFEMKGLAWTPEDAGLFDCTTAWSACSTTSISRLGGVYSLDVSNVPAAWMGQLHQVQCQVRNAPMSLDDYLAANPGADPWMADMDGDGFVPMGYIGPPASLSLTNVELGSAVSDLTTDNGQVVATLSSPVSDGDVLPGLSFTIEWTCPTS